MYFSIKIAELGSLVKLLQRDFGCFCSQLLTLGVLAQSGGRHSFSSPLKKRNETA